MSADIVKSKREGRKQRRNNAWPIQPQPASPEGIDHQRNSNQSQSHRRHALQREFLLLPGHRVQQNPNRRRVLQCDGGRHVRLLNRHVVEIVRYRYTEKSQERSLQQITLRQAERRPAAQDQKHRQQDQKRKRGPALGKNQRIDWAQSLSAGKKPAGKSCAPQSRGDSPQECGRSDVEISPVWFARVNGQSEFAA